MIEALSLGLDYDERLLLLLLPQHRPPVSRPPFSIDLDAQKEGPPQDGEVCRRSLSCCCCCRLKVSLGQAVGPPRPQKCNKSRTNTRVPRTNQRERDFSYCADVSAEASTNLHKERSRRERHAREIFLTRSFDPCDPLGPSRL